MLCACHDLLNLVAHSLARVLGLRDHGATQKGQGAEELVIWFQERMCDGLRWLLYMPYAVATCMDGLLARQLRFKCSRCTLLL